jgi:hypothetical protein
MLLEWAVVLESHPKIACGRISMSLVAYMLADYRFNWFRNLLFGY